MDGYLTVPKQKHKEVWAIFAIYAETVAQTTIFGCSRNQSDLQFVCIKHINRILTAPEDAHKRLVLQVYLGSNTSEFSAIRR